MWNPLTGESKATRKPMQGVAYARGIKSAYRSATLSGEYIPAATRKMGIVNVGVGETLGTKPKLLFTRRDAPKISKGVKFKW